MKIQRLHFFTSFVSILVGNKLDLIDDGEHTREVAVSEALEFARELNIDYIETSALSGQGVEVMFRRLVLSVAKLLPEIKVHLELTSLPEGWMIQFNEEMASKPERQVSSSSDGRTTLDPSSLHSSVTGSSGPNSTPNSTHIAAEDIPVRPLSTAQHRQSVADRLREDFLSKYVYVNYWTGEKQTELPLKAAPTGLLFMSGTPIAKDDVDKEEFQRKSLE